MAIEKWIPVTCGPLMHISNWKNVRRYVPIGNGQFKYALVNKSEIFIKEDGKSYVQYDPTSPEGKLVCIDDELANASFDDVKEMINPKLHWTSPSGFKMMKFEKDIASNPGWKKIPLELLNRNLTAHVDCHLQDKGNSRNKADVWASKWGQVVVAVKNDSGKVTSVGFPSITEKNTSSSSKNKKEESTSTRKNVTFSLSRDYWSLEEDEYLKAKSSKKTNVGLNVYLAKLIADAFNRFRLHPKCTTLIFADGDYRNCSFSNLIWTTTSPHDTAAIVKMYENVDPATKIIRKNCNMMINFDA